MSRKNYLLIIRHTKTVAVVALVVVSFAYHKLKIKSVEETERERIAQTIKFIPEQSVSHHYVFDSKGTLP